MSPVERDPSAPVPAPGTGPNVHDDRLEKRRAYEAAKTRYRAYYERHYPTPVLGGRPAEPVTAEVTEEIARLAAAIEVARIAWENAPRD